MVELNPSAQLHDLIEEEWQYRLREDPFFATQVGDRRYNDRVPSIAAAAEAQRAAQVEQFLQRLGAIPSAALDASEQINQQILERELSERLAHYRFGAHLMPLSKMIGPHIFLPDLVLLTPFHSEEDYAAYLSRLSALPGYLQELIDGMRAGQQRGLVPPRAALAGTETSLQSLAAPGVEQSVFYQPFLSLPENIPSERRAALRQAGEQVLREQVLPAFQRLLDFLTQEYLPSARASIAISALPGGEAYYAFLTRAFTSLELSPQQVFETGMAEVRRIRQEMESLIRSTGFEGGLQDFLRFLSQDAQFYATRPEDLMGRVALILKRMDGELPRLFATLPRTPYGLRETPPHLAPYSTSAYYFPATGDGTTAGYYYVNTYDLASRPLYEYEALSFHEAVPGHHLQLALQQEMTGAPNFRRCTPGTAFVEGWALYAERLGLEVGFYRDPYSNFGRLVYEMWRACRLVVDPGMHCLGWTRQQAIEFMAENTALSRLNIENEVDRYIAWPGQALAYKIGELKLRELRAQAEAALGARFDLRQFHRVLLEEGAIPLDLVERRLKDWMATF